MLYPQNVSDHLSPELFKKPTSEYRATPFWAWNCDLKKEELLWQIERLKEMGMGGFHMHCRSGMSTPYLTDGFMELVRSCVEKAKDEKMLAWLYDEDRWPSGAAGGIVTKDYRYRARSLRITDQMRENESPIARWAVSLDENKCLKGYRRLRDGEQPEKGEFLRYGYLEIRQNSTWFNNQAYLDTLNPEAVRRFIEVTHERYAQWFEKDFGDTVPAIFTDEPQFSAKLTLSFPDENADAVLPWTDDLDDTFRAAYGESLLDKLPEVLWELPDGQVSPVRYHFHDHVTERFTQAFSDQIGAWCEKHHIMLTGHMMEEPTLRSQTRMLGEAMRAYRGFQLPGIDMLCDWREYTTAKQTQSASHQYGRPGVLSELYGVTNWDFDFRGHKSQGDWQAALGVTVRVPHLSWVSMEGEAKRDYPASISYQSPWYKEYAYVEDHFARLNTALTRGKPEVKVGVIHPIESYWLRFGPASQTAARRQEMDERFQQVTGWLLEGLVDFDFICESLLPSQCEKGGAPLQVGQMAYDAIVVPACETLRATTLDRLEAFAAAGGKLIFMGDVPQFVDALPSDRPEALAKKTQKISYACFDLLDALERQREIDVRKTNGERMPHLLHQMRRDGEDRWLFLCNDQKPERIDCPDEWECTLTIKGMWQPTIYDTMTGEIKPCPCQQKNGNTLVPLVWHGHDSLLLYLAPGQVQSVLAAEQKQESIASEEYSIFYAEMLAASASKRTEIARFRGSFPVTLSEPNVVLLDQAEYAYDDGPWQPKDELLRIEARLRKEHNLQERGGAQPWVVPVDTHFEHYLTLRFTIPSEISCGDVSLALERPETTEITWNGKKITALPDGYYVDKSIKRIPLPGLKEGVNTLILRLPLANRFGAEWCYLLGDFGVRVQGDEAVVTSPVRKLGFGDWTSQGLPFYAGNVTYYLPLEAEGDFVLQISKFRNPLLAVSLDGKRQGVIAYSPYRLPVSCAPGHHTLEITAYGNRRNAFGQVHCADETLTWFGPDSWRTSGARWADEYQLARTGILASPVILK